MSTPTEKLHLRSSIAGNCAKATANEPHVHYSQQRPFRFYDNIGVGQVVLDCSGFVINCFWNAMHDLKVYVADPSGQKYSGYGNTWTMETWLKEHGKNVTAQPTFWVGDVAMFDGHTMICSKDGTASTSVWTSHGQESGPEPRKLNYRPGARVYRHPALL